MVQDQHKTFMLLEMNRLKFTFRDIWTALKKRTPAPAPFQTIQKGGIWRKASEFAIDPSRLELMLRVFYGLLAVKYGYMIRSLTETGSPPPDFHPLLWPVLWLSRLTGALPPSSVAALFFLFGLALCLACALFPGPRRLRFAAFLLFFFSLALNIEMEHAALVGHGNYGALFVSFFLSFMKIPRAGESAAVGRRSRFYYQAAALSFLGTYFLAGLWKARSLMQEAPAVQWNRLLPNAALSLIHNNKRALNNRDEPFVAEILGLAEHFGALLWPAAIVFQLSLPLAAFFPSLLRPFGVSVILFHIATGVLFEVWWHFTQAVAFVLLLGHPLTRRPLTRRGRTEV